MAIEDLELEFQINLDSVRFSHLGRYYLELVVQNSAPDASKLLSKVTHRINSGEAVVGAKARTDVIEQIESDKQLTFTRSKFVFYLPRGFCKNDSNHDVRLMIEAFQLKDKRSNTGSGSRVSQNMVAIYPRAHLSQVDLKARHDSHMFHVQDEFSLLRTASGDPIQVHAGRISVDYSLKEYIAPSPLSPSEPPPQRQVAAPTHRLVRSETPEDLGTPSEITIDHIPQSDNELFAADENANLNFFLENSPLPSREAISVAPAAGEGGVGVSKGGESGNGARGGLSLELPAAGSEIIHIKAHAALNLPEDKFENKPTPYIVARVVPEEGSVLCEGVTKAVGPSFTPYWNEHVSLHVTTDSDHGGGHMPHYLLMVVADGPSKETLSSYKFSLANIQPFIEYHFDFSKINRSKMGECNVYVSVLRLTSSLPRDFPSLPYLALLCDVTGEAEAVPPTHYTVTRVVPNATQYCQEMLWKHSRPAGVRTQSVLFPKPLKEAFSLPQGHLHGYPQVKLPGGSEVGVGVGSSVFLPSKELPSLFTPTSALVVELFDRKRAMSAELGWSLSAPSAFAVVPLNKSLLLTLMAAQHNALSLKNVPLRGNSNKSTVVTVFVHLIDSSESMSVAGNVEEVEFEELSTKPNNVGQPDAPPPRPPQREDRGEREAAATAAVFPPWNSVFAAANAPVPPRGMQKQYPGHHTGAAPAAANTLPRNPINQDELPPEDSLNAVLGAAAGQSDAYLYRVPKGDAPPPAAGADLDDGFLDYDSMQAPPNRYQRPAAGEFDDRAMRIIDLQMQDLENYRRAVKKMSEDILRLREQVSRVESHNSQLRRQVALSEESSKALLNVAELEGVSKADLIDRYIALRRKMAELSNEVKQYKDKVQILQNQVIKKNDKEKAYMQLQQAHTAQQALLMKYQDKSAKYSHLEETVRAQEKVIAKMERLFHQKGRTIKDADDQRQRIEEALKAENDRLRAELKRERQHRQAMEDREAERVLLGEGSDKSALLHRELLNGEMKWAKCWAEKGALSKVSAGESGGEVSAEMAARLKSVEHELEEKDLKYFGLHKALEDNSRLWGREKEELLRRITELERGFARSPVMILGGPPPPPPPHHLHKDRILSPHYRPKNWPSRLEPIG